MEKKIKTKSAFKKTTDIFRRNTKSRLAIQKFLNDLQEQESEYLNENKQITQCVFLGALCLKPVPDIFQVTLQPISFTTQSKTSILYNNIGKTVNNNVTRKDDNVKSEDTSKVEIKKNHRKNKTSTIKTNVFISNVCDQKPRNRILELFNNKNLSIDGNNHAKPSSVRLELNEKSKDKKIKYKIKVGGTLNRNKKELKKQSEEKVPVKTEKCSRKDKTISEKTSKAKVPKHKPSPKKKIIRPEAKEVNKNFKTQNKGSNYNVSNIIPTLKIKIRNKRCKSDLEIKNSAVDNAIERLRKNRGIEVTKMETKMKKIPSLVPVKEVTCENHTWQYQKKTQIGQVEFAVIDSCDMYNNIEQEAGFLKEESVDLMEMVDDEIEDYLEIDQNIVADLEALIPEEEIESISNTFISSAIQIPDTSFTSDCNNSEIKPVDYVIEKTSLNDRSSDFKKFDAEILVDTGKSKDIIKIDDIKEDVEIEKVVILDSIDNNKRVENSELIEVLGTAAINVENTEVKPENSSEQGQIFYDIERSEQQTKVTKRKSEDASLISKKQKVTVSTQEEPVETKHNKREKQVRKSSQKIDAKFTKHFNVKPKLEILKNVRKITDFLFPIEKNDEHCANHSTDHKAATLEYRRAAKQETQNTSEKISDSVSAHMAKESRVETRSLRSCNKPSSSRDDTTKLKKIELPKLIPVNNSARNRKEVASKEPKLVSASNVRNVSENVEVVQSKEITVPKNEVENICEYNGLQIDENVILIKCEQILPASKETECNFGPPTKNTVSAMYESPNKLITDEFVKSQIVIPLNHQKDDIPSCSKDNDNQPAPKETRKVAKESICEKKTKIGPSDNSLVMETQIKEKSEIDSNERLCNLDKIPELMIPKTRLRSESAANMSKQSNSKIIEKYADLNEETKGDVSTVRLCSQVTCEMEEKQTDSKIKFNDKIGTQSNEKIGEKQQNNHLDSDEIVMPKIRNRSKIADTNHKVENMSKMLKERKSRVVEVKPNNAVEVVIPENKEVAPNLESKNSKITVFDYDNPTEFPIENIKATDKNISKTKGIYKVSNDSPSSMVQQFKENPEEQQAGHLQSVHTNESEEPISSTEITKGSENKTKISNLDSEDQKEHDEIPLKTGSLIDTQEKMSNPVSNKTRFQLRKIKTGEISSKIIEFKKSTELNNSITEIDDHNLEQLEIQKKNMAQSKNQSSIFHPGKGAFEANVHMELEVKENTLKTPRNSRKNKIQNKPSSTLSQLEKELSPNAESKSIKKKNSMKTESELGKKWTTKEFVEQKTGKKTEVLKNVLSLPETKSKQLGSNTKRKNVPRLKAGNLKVLSTRSQLKAKTTLKRLTYLTSKSEKKIQIKKNKTKQATQNISKGIKRKGQLKKLKGGIRMTAGNTRKHKKNLFKSKSFGITSSKVQIIDVQASDSNVAVPPIDKNKIGMSNNKRRNKIAKARRIENIVKTETNTEKLSIKISAVGENSGDDGMKISGSNDDFSNVLFNSAASGEIAKRSINVERDTSRNKRSVGQREIISKNQNSKYNQKKRNILKREYSPNTLKNETEMDPGNIFEENTSERQHETNNSQDFLDETKKEECLSGRSEPPLNNREEKNETKLTDVLSSRDIASPKQEKSSTEIESSKVEKVAAKNRGRKKVQKTSLISKVQKDADNQLTRKNILQKVLLGDASLDTLSKPKPKLKHQSKKEDISVTDEDEILSQLEQQHDKRSKKNISHDLSDQRKIANSDKESKILEKFGEQDNVHNVAIDVLQQFQSSSTSVQKNITIESVKVVRDSLKKSKRIKKQNKSPISQAHNNVDDLMQQDNVLAKTVKGISQENINCDSEKNIVELFQQDGADFLQDITKIEECSKVETDIKLRRRTKIPTSKVHNDAIILLEQKDVPIVDSPTIFLTNVVAKSKNRKKASPKGDETEINITIGTLSNEKGKLEVPKKIKVEKTKSNNVEIDMTPEVMASPDQLIPTAEEGSIKVEVDNKEQTESPIPKTRKDLDMLHSKNVSDRTGIWLLQQKLNRAFAKTIGEELQQNTRKTETREISNKTRVIQQNESVESLNSVVKTNNQEENYDGAQIIALKELPNDAGNAQIIAEDKSLKKNDLVKELENPEVIAAVHSARVETQVPMVEAKKRTQRRAERQHLEMNMKVPRKKRNNVNRETNSSKMEIEKLNAVDGDKIGYSIPYLMKEDLSNPNSELSQEIERQMQLEFSREFPNYGPTAPEPYRRIYRCRICLLVCETYGRLKQHRRIHDVATPYQCQHCDKSFDDVEVLAAHLRIHREVDYAVVEQENDVEAEQNDVANEEGNIEEHMSIVDQDMEQDESIDIKPLRNIKTCSKENDMQSLSIRKEKSLERQKKAEVIQMKIAEIKERLCIDIKKEVDRERMGICQKLTRSKVKQFSVKHESQAETSEVQEEENEDETFVEGSESEYEKEEEDPYAYDDDPDYEVEEDVNQTIFKEYEEMQIVDMNGGQSSDNLDINESAKAEYLAEQETTNQKSNAKNMSHCKTKGRRRGEKKEFEVFELKLDSLPPLILKTVKNKTLIVGKMPYPCKKCDSSFWTSAQLERHQLVHVLKKVAPSNSAGPKKVFKCEVCGKEFKKICDLERHTRVHTGEKPSVCNICNKRFQQPYNLHKHLLTHTQEKNFECVICQKRFGRNDVLNRHVLTHSIDKPYHCSICMKTFIRNSQLKLHLRKHHGMSVSEANVAAAEREAEKGAGRAPPTSAQEKTDDAVAGTSSC